MAIAYNDSSVMNVPPIFRCCKALALAICRNGSIRKLKLHTYEVNNAIQVQQGAFVETKNLE